MRRAVCSSGCERYDLTISFYLVKLFCRDLSMLLILSRRLLFYWLSLLRRET